MAAYKRGFFLKRTATGLCCAFAFALSSALSVTCAGEAIMVLDASRSMWGQVAKKPKYLMVHEALATALERDQRIVPKFGLVSYGNSSPSRCDDISAMFKPGASDHNAILQSMKDLKPWGLTPISGALRKAAEEFTNTSQRNRIVLVADGLENCGGDPCKTALDLKAQFPGLTIDVVALRVAKEDRAKLSCIATATGGVFLAASTQAQLTEAGATVIDRIVSASRAPDDVPTVHMPAGDKTDPSSPLQQAAPVPRPNPQGYMRRLALIEPRTKPDPSEDWAVDPSDSSQWLAETVDGLEPPPRPDPRGPEATPETEPTQIDADLIQTAAIPVDDTQAQQPESATVLDEVAARAQEPDTAPPPAAQQKPELDISNQSAPDRQGIKLQAKLTAEMRKIGKPVDWTVYKVEDVDKALWKQVAAVRAAEPTFKLEPGTYLVRARYGYISASKMVAVTEGKLTDATFVLNAGGLRILSHLVFVDAPGGTTATHYVYSGETDDNGMRQLIAKSDIQGEIIRLNAGRYRVISRLGDANSVVSTDVDVSPGVLTAVEVNHKAGVLSLEVNGRSEDAQPSATNVVVFDAEGRLVVRIRGDEATALLAPGRYTISAEQAGKNVTQDIEIRIGEAKTINLKLK